MCSIFRDLTQFDQVHNHITNLVRIDDGEIRQVVVPIDGLLDVREILRLGREEGLEVFVETSVPADLGAKGWHGVLRNVCAYVVSDEGEGLDLDMTVTGRLTA